jgi:hypothetical protein
MPDELVERMISTHIPTKEPGELNLNQRDLYLTRFTPPWMRPVSLDARFWRRVVMNQPIAMICRETLIANILSLDWKISPRDSTQQDELKPVIKYYTRLLERGTDGNDFETHMEFIMTDALDLPFGGAAEIGRKGDSPTGRVQWIAPIDGGTLYPTLNKDLPVVQYLPEASFNPVWFPSHAISRVFVSPRTPIMQQGWGMAPPEKIWFAMELLWRGDKYYANLLLDIPPAGILDLGDMEKEAALGWVDAYKELLSTNSSEAFKIPVLYEHNNDVKFLPLGNVPNAIMYDSITLKYASIVAAAYGMSLSDLGMSSSTNGGETLAGSIRQERKTRRTGYSRMKKKIKRYIETILPDNLQFDWIDYDDELNLAVARARLANATAFSIFAKEGIFARQELRSQTIQDGLFTVSIPENIPAGTIPESEKTAKLQAANNPKNTGKVKNPESLTKPVAVSAGGHGDIKKVAYNRPDSSVVRRSVYEITEQFYPLLDEIRTSMSEDDVFQARTAIEESLFEDDEMGLEPVVDSVSSRLGLSAFFIEKPELLSEVTEIVTENFKEIHRRAFEVKSVATIEPSVKDLESLKSRIELAVNECYDPYIHELNSFANKFLTKCVVLALKDQILSGEDIDFGAGETYNSIVNNVQDRFEQKFDEVMKSALNIVNKDLLDKVEELING